MRNAYELRGDVAVIFLGQRDAGVRECLIDAADLPLVQAAPRRWTITTGHGQKKYVSTVIPEHQSKSKKVMLHRFLLGEPPCLIDHKDGNGFDCRRNNLRASNHAQNNLNRACARTNSRTGIQRVSWFQNRWVAKASGKYLGRFRDIRDAAHAVYMRLIDLDPIAATSFLRSLPSTPPLQHRGNA